MENNEATTKLKILKGNSSLSIKNRLGDYLTIQFSDLSMTLLDKLQHQPLLASEEIIDGIIGIFSGYDQNYLITITKSEFICKINGKEIRKVLETNFISLSEYSEVKEELQPIIPSLQEIFKTGFYFSNEYDLSNNFSSQLQLTNANTGVYDKLLEGNPLCLANYKFIHKFAINVIGDNFISNCIYGFVGRMEHSFFDGKKMEIILISRRCIQNFGISYFKQGLGKYGTVANQIETELIVNYNNMEGMFSYLMLSGDFPCYYKELTGGKGNKNIKAYNEYIKSILDEYCLVCFIGLHSKIKEKEVIMKQKFKNLLKGDMNKDYHFKYYDLGYDEIGTGEYDFYYEFVKKREKIIDMLGFSAMGGKMYLQQNGLLCVNGNNINEINDFQKRVFWYVMQKELALKHINITDMFNPNNYFIEMENNHQFLNTYLNLWKLNLQSVKPQYTQVMEEPYARNYQRILELTFNETHKTKKLNDYLNYFKSKFSSQSKIHVYIATWNTGASDIRNANPDLSQWLLPKNGNESLIPDIYLVGLEEAIKLTTKNVISKTKDTEEIIHTWEEKITNTISRGGQLKYVRKETLNLVGIVFMVFFKEEKMKCITDSTPDTIKTGLGGAAGTQGSCRVSFTYNNTSFAVSCSHLNAGVSKITNRVNEIMDILHKSLNDKNEHPQVDPSVSSQLNTNLNINELITKEFGAPIRQANTISFNTPSKEFEIKKENESPAFGEHDVWFLFGDLNFRLDTDYENSMNYIEKNDIKHLTEFDQLCKSRIALSNLKDNVDETPIKFAPTYKFLLGKNEYENNEAKKRVPSYCDRILFKLYKENKMIRPLEYNSVMNGGFDISDHRPVYGIFEVTVFEDIQKLKSIYEEEIGTNIALGISSEYMKKPMNTIEKL